MRQQARPKNTATLAEKNQRAALDAIIVNIFSTYLYKINNVITNIYMKKIKNRIFVDKKINSNDQIILDANQIHYLKSVLRTKKNDYISVFNRELLCLTKVINITKNKCELEIIDQKKIESEDHNITLFFSPIKRTPLEIMIQKCSEIGISIFQPVIMERTNMKNVNFERLRLIAVEACEQSNRNKIPEINKPISFATMINDNSLAGYLYCSLDNNEEKIKNRKLTKNEAIGIIIGPEGDFSAKEYESLKSKKKSIGVTLGPNILKSETAAITATSIIMDKIYNA